jgi:hypothetical protein
MATDITKWSDHALILSRHANGLLPALYSVKKQLDLENGPSSDLLLRGGITELSICFRGNNINPESPARPPASRLSLFIDPTIAGIQKQIIKKFPEGGDLGKASQAIQVQAPEFLKDLKPYYDLFSAVAEYLDMCIPVLLASQKFKLTVLIDNVDGEFPGNVNAILGCTGRAFQSLDTMRSNLADQESGAIHLQQSTSSIEWRKCSELEQVNVFDVVS